LYVALDAGYLNQNQFESLHNQAAEVARLVSGLTIATERRRHQELKRDDIK
jgi:hypothetical protein